MEFALVGAGIFVVPCGLVALFIYASSVVSDNYFEGDDDVPALSAERARRREGDPQRIDLGALSTLPAAERRREPPRDPAIGVDQARAEVRERIRRYNQREVRR